MKDTGFTYLSPLFSGKEDVVFVAPYFHAILVGTALGLQRMAEKLSVYKIDKG